MKTYNFTSNDLPELSALSVAQQERVEALRQNISKETNKPYVTESQAICIALLTDSSFLSEIRDVEEKARIKNHLFCTYLINPDCYKIIGKAIHDFCVSKCGFLYMGVGTDDIAEDVLQECLLKSFKKLDEFEGNASITTWIVSYAQLTLKEQLRIIKKHSLEEKIIAPLNSKELPDDVEAIAQKEAKPCKKVSKKPKDFTPEPSIQVISNGEDGDFETDIYTPTSLTPEEIVIRDELCSIRRDVLAEASETISSQDRRGKILTIWLKYANLDQIRKIKRASNEEKEAEGKVTLQQIADEYNQDPSNLDKIDHNKVKRVTEKFQTELQVRYKKAIAE